MSGVPLERQHDDDDAVLCEVLPVAKHDIADITDTKSVDENATGLYVVLDLCLRDTVCICNGEYITIFNQQALVLVDANFLRKTGGCFSMMIFAMHRNRVLRLYE